MVQVEDGPQVEVREAKKVSDNGVEVIRRRNGLGDAFVAHIPESRTESALEELASHVDGKEVVSSEEAEAIRLMREQLCD